MRASAFAFVLCLGLLWVLPCSSLAQAFFDQPRQFIPERDCEAYSSIRRQTAPVRVTPGQPYSALGENKRPGGTHALIEVDEQRKWVALDCGRLGPSDTTGGDVDDDSTDQTDCLPFFDTTDNPIPAGFGGLVDITPPPPPIEHFGEALNAVCGEPGKVVSRDEFRTMMREHAAVLERIMAFTSGRVFADRPVRDDVESYLDDLTDAWFALHAFDHIICGEPRPGGNIGGLHFHGRYQQLQADGSACRIPNFARNEVVPGVIYSMGVRIPMPGGDASAPIKGYGLTMSGEDILQVVTRAFAENPTPSSSSVGCLLAVSDDGHDFTTVFVRRRTGIRTFFPDATPDPRRNGPCAAPIPLASADGNRPPEVAAPLPPQQVPANALTELSIAAKTFRDPDGDALSLAGECCGTGLLPTKPWLSAWESEYRGLRGGRVVDRRAE